MSMKKHTSKITKSKIHGYNDVNTIINRAIYSQEHAFTEEELYEITKEKIQEDRFPMSLHRLRGMVQYKLYSMTRCGFLTEKSGRYTLNNPWETRENGECIYVAGPPITFGINGDDTI